MNVSVNDLSNVRAGMFDLGNGEFSKDKPEGNFRSVIAFVDNEKKLAYGLCPVRIMLPWCLGFLPPSDKVFDNGREQTKFLLQEANSRGLVLPAAEFCNKYEAFGVSKGEAFLPTKKELSFFGRNKIMQAWRSVNLDSGDCTMLSSTMDNDGNVWLQSYAYNSVSSFVMQQRTFGVIPVITIQL